MLNYDVNTQNNMYMDLGHYIFGQTENVSLSLIVLPQLLTLSLPIFIKIRKRKKKSSLGTKIKLLNCYSEVKLVFGQ